MNRMMGRKGQQEPKQFKGNDFENFEDGDIQIPTNSEPQFDEEIGKEDMSPPQTTVIGDKQPSIKKQPSIMAADQDTEEIVFGAPIVDNQGAGGGEEAIPEADDDDFK